ncbi:unnamed protein product [Mesocestoides corti]|uniref:Histone-lysine N-methyltransferase n=2 Tax=Mesocestoides corti TaxID=53468 RepID=A0A158QT09_MESCO|nr:unnamed protein product [Mesocestoides corti]
MEYDPASPTDELEEKTDVVDVDAIPLPDKSVHADVESFLMNSVGNIPLPPGRALSVDSIPMPPEITKRPTYPFPPPPPPSSENIIQPDSGSKNDQSLLSFRIKPVSKRSRPGTLPTGVLPTKTKHPEIEVKTELFKPTKEDELEIMAELNSDNSVNPQVSIQPSLTAISEAILARIGNATQGEQDLASVLRDINQISQVSNLSAQNQNVADVTMSNSEQISSKNIQTEVPTKSVAGGPQISTTSLSDDRSTYRTEINRNQKTSGRSRSRSSAHKNKSKTTTLSRSPRRQNQKQSPGERHSCSKSHRRASRSKSFRSRSPHRSSRLISTQSHRSRSRPSRKRSSSRTVSRAPSVKKCARAASRSKKCSPSTSKHRESPSQSIHPSLSPQKKSRNASLERKHSRSKSRHRKSDSRSINRSRSSRSKSLAGSSDKRRSRSRSNFSESGSVDKHRFRSSRHRIKVRSPVRRNRLRSSRRRSSSSARKARRSFSTNQRLSRRSRSRKRRSSSHERPKGSTIPKHRRSACERSRSSSNSPPKPSREGHDKSRKKDEVITRKRDSETNKENESEIKKDIKKRSRSSSSSVSSNSPSTSSLSKNRKFTSTDAIGNARSATQDVESSKLKISRSCKKESTSTSQSKVNRSSSKTPTIDLVKVNGSTKNSRRMSEKEKGPFETASVCARVEPEVRKPSGTSVKGGLVTKDTKRSSQRSVSSNLQNKKPEELKENKTSPKTVDKTSLSINLTSSGIDSRESLPSSSSTSGNSKSKSSKSKSTNTALPSSKVHKVVSRKESRPVDSESSKTSKEKASGLIMDSGVKIHLSVVEVEEKGDEVNVVNQDPVAYDVQPIGRVGPHTPESPTQRSPSGETTDVSSAVTQECTVASLMTLDECDQERISSVIVPIGRNKTALTHPSYSSTSSTSCHTPLSSSSSSVSDCTGSPKRSIRKGGDSVGGLKRPKAIADSDSDDSVSNSRYRLRRRKNISTNVGEVGTPLDESSCATPPVNISQLLQPFEVQPIERFSNRAGVPRPEYQHVLENDYTLIEASLLREGVDPGDNPAFPLRGGGGDWVCDCEVPTMEDLLSGKLGCGQGCINRAVYIECGKRCPAHAVCSNRQFQLRLYAQTEPYFCGPEKGWGLRALKLIPKGTFIVEYAGEVIDFPEFRRRVRLYEKAKRVHHYFMSLGPEHFIDAGTKGNWARFVNHSCEPNSETQKWMVNGQIRIGFFAISDIPAGEEITIDYQFAQYGLTEQKCYCGTPSCSGIMGAKSKQLQDKVRLKDTRAVERRIIQLLTGKTLRTAEDVTFLIQVMVQEYLTRYTRMELLKLLADTKTESYLKLFRQYNGLELLASYMCDTAPTDWELKRQILVCLDHIPISEQKQVQTDSSLMEFVRQWTLDPRYCRSRGVTKKETDTTRNEPRVVAEPSTTQLGPVPPQNSIKDTVALEQHVAPLPLELLKDVGNNADLHNGDSTEPCLESSNLEVGRSQPSLPPDANAIKLYSPDEEKVIIENIRQLAGRILERWSKLPVETYRIPRLEREETEQSILQSSRSALVSWGISPTKDDSFHSWRLLSQDSTQSKCSVANHSSPRSDRQRHRRDRKRSSKLTRSERRAQFEANMRAAEAAASSILASKTTLNRDNALSTPSDNSTLSTSVYDLLLNVLSRKISKVKGNDATLVLQQTISVLSKKLCEFAEKEDTEGLVAYLRSLTDGTSPITDGGRPSIDGAESSQAPPAPLPSPSASSFKLEPPWCSAIDASTGRTYYYNSITRAVQWEFPSVPVEAVGDASNPYFQNDQPAVKKRDFLSEVYACTMKLLKPFRLPNCLTGRLESDDDMKYVAKKVCYIALSFCELRQHLISAFVLFAEKEKARCQPGHEPQLNREMVEHFRLKVTRYLTSKGEVYVRSRHSVQPPQASVGGDDDCDMEIDNDDS